MSTQESTPDDMEALYEGCKCSRPPGCCWIADEDLSVRLCGCRSDAAAKALYGGHAVPDRPGERHRAESRASVRCTLISVVLFGLVSLSSRTKCRGQWCPCTKETR